jgi:Transglutaminase-like superfamily.
MRRANTYIFNKHVIALPLTLLLIVVSLTGCTKYGDIYSWDFRSENNDSSSTANNTEVEYSLEEYSLRYNFQKLSDSERNLYVKIQNCVFSYGYSVDTDGYEYDTIKNVFTAFCGDFPECFWINGDWNARGYESLGTNYYTDLVPEYRFTKTQKEEVQNSIDVIINSFLARVDAGASDYDKMLDVYNFIAAYAKYDDSSADKITSGSVDNSTDRSCAIDGFFIDKLAVCSGFSKATQILLNRLGIECAYVTGTASGSGHSWNLVKLDGEYYYTDTTWAATKESGESAIDYGYFCMTTNELLYDHIIGSDMELPYCDAIKLDYYVYNGLVADSADPNELAAIFRLSLKSNNTGTYISVKFTSSDIYSEACTALFDNSGIFGILNQIGMQNNDASLSYSTDDGRLIITVYLD